MVVTHVRHNVRGVTGAEGGPADGRPTQGRQRPRKLSRYVDQIVRCDPCPAPSRRLALLDHIRTVPWYDAFPCGTKNYFE